VDTVFLRAVVPAFLLGALAASFPACGGSATGQPPSSASGVPSTKARRIAAQWGGAVTYLPNWAPRGVALSNWWAEGLDSAADDNRLVVQFVRRATHLDWEVSDPRETDRVAGGIVCRYGRFAARFISGRTVFYRRRTGSEIAWVCIPASGTYAPGFAIRRLTISLRQHVGRVGQLRASDLERMVASAQPSPPGRAPDSHYELPPQREVKRMAASFRRPLFVPTRLPGGFIFSQWRVSPHRDSLDRRRVLDVTFGRDALSTLLVWTVYSGIDKEGFDCPRKPLRLAPTSAQHQILIHRRSIYAIEGIHGVSVWTCVRANTVGNAKPLEIAVWYNIRLHSPAMLSLAMRMIGYGKLVRTK